jgi:hypothetical protein
MATKVSIDDCKYVLVNTSYLDRLFFPKYNTKLKEALNDWKDAWSENENDCRLVYVKDSKWEERPGERDKLVPFQTIVDGTEQEVATIQQFCARNNINDAGCFCLTGPGPFAAIAMIMDVDYCANFCMHGLNS